MKLIEIVGSVEALNKLSETKLPAVVAFSLGKFLKEISGDVETYNKVRSEKAKQYGTLIPSVDKDGNSTEVYSFSKDGKVTPDGEKYVAEMQEIENRELEIKIPEIKIKDLGDSVIEPRHMVSLSWLIKE